MNRNIIGGSKGGPPVYALQWDPILSFLHKCSPKSTCVEGRHPTGPPLNMIYFAKPQALQLHSLKWNLLTYDHVPTKTE